MRVALGVEYDGGRFYGWQSQPNMRTVQRELERALSKVADHDIKLFSAGRTDTGVHATGQVVHFDTTVERSSHSWVYGANSNLPQDVSVRWAKVVDEEFHARFKAVRRRYRYVIYNHPIRSSTFTSAVTWQYRPLDQTRMLEAAQYLVGEHDFTSFRAIDCQAKSPVRTIHDLKLTRKSDLIILDVTANAFLHHMVRNIAGVLIAVGAGKQEVAWVKQVLDAKDRTQGGETAPPYGLYLVEVQYPEQFSLPNSVIGPMFLTE